MAALPAGPSRLTASGRAGAASAVLRIPADAELQHDVYLDD